MKAKEYDGVRLLAELQGDFGEHVPQGTEGAVIEVFTNPEGYMIDVAIPDDSKDGGYRYDCVTVHPDQFDVISVYAPPANDLGVNPSIEIK